jgi:phosphoglycerol transferase
MKNENRQSSRKVLALAALGAVLAVCWAQELWRVEDWRTPLTWHKGGDSLFNVLLAQNIEETGWYEENYRLGAPGTLELYTFPATILGPMLAFKVLGIVLTPGAVVSAFYLLGWPLAAMVAAWVFLKLDLSPPLATGMGVLFAALPAHAIRGEPHLFLANLALIPPSLLTAHALARQGLSTRGRIWAFAFALILGASDAYYAFFGSLFVLLGAAIGGFQHRRLRRVLDALTFAALAVLGIVLATLPTLLRGVESVAERTPADSSLLGIKLGQLLMPVISHRYPPFARLSGRYLAGESAPGLATESVATALGWIGSLGLLLLFAHLLGFRLPSARPESTTVFASFAVVAILFATVGGFSSLFVTFVSPQIRAHNRISVFVAFAALAATGLLVQGLLERQPGGGRGTRAWITAALLTVFGVWDQSSLMAIPNHAENARDWAVDREWVAKAEERLPRGAMVFQLPWIPFPESPPQEGTHNFEALRPILHSHSLRWSYGATKNSPTDLWQRAVLAMPPAEMVAVLRTAGFAALVLDRSGYNDNAMKLGTQLRRRLGPPLVASADRRWELFSLSAERPVGDLDRLPEPEVFSDSFESGGSDRWSTAAP